MRRWIAVAVLALGCTTLAPAQVQPAPSDLRIAVTIDDLPWQRHAETDAGQMAEGHHRLMAQLRQAGVPVIGFVNEQGLEVGGALSQQRLQMLEDWLEAGATLGNHTFAHTSLHDIGVKAFNASVLEGERQLRPMLARRGMTPKWFRHPYLRSGRTPEERAQVETFLAAHGYRTAPVTVDNGEWVWAFAYANVMSGKTKVDDREGMLRRLREGYIPYMLNKLAFYERNSQDLFRRQIAQVWLIHANELNADAYADLISAAKRRGYRLISLDEAMQDSAYAHADGYRGKWGPSWLHRWAMAERKPASFYEGEPVVPPWVLGLAGVEAE